MSDPLVNLLKKKREQWARRAGVEPFMILSNATILATAIAKPKSIAELSAIKGWGEKKTAQYGQEVIDLVVHGIVDQGKKTSPGVLTVSDFLGSVNEALASFGTVRVQGELSDIGLSNGMAFFDLKDDGGADAVAKCFLGSWRFSWYQHLLTAGMTVVITGRPSIYKSGFFRIVVDKIEPVGEGALQQAFDALKKELTEKGYFDPARKRAVPSLVRKIGLITSASGAAVTDFKRNLGEYGFDVRLAHVRVEGDRAEASISAALQNMNRNHADVDVIVLIRGGGGLENLKTFNSKTIADAIMLSRLPVIVGIGHERDETIVDFVADRSFSTPTAVANFLRTQHEQWLRRVDDLAMQLLRAQQEQIRTTRQVLEHSTVRLVRAQEQQLERLALAVRHASSTLNSTLQKIFAHFHHLEQRLASALQAQLGWVRSTQQHLTDLAAQLSALNPERVLQRGYSLVYDESGVVVQSVKQATVGQRLKIHLAQGKLHTKVERKEA